MKILNDKNFFRLLHKQNFIVEIEDRVKLGYNTYGMNNHAEFIKYLNPHDNCLWDAIIPGYRKKLKGGGRYNTTDIIGVYYLANGNHKIAVKIDKDGYDSNKSKKDIVRYIKSYKKKIPVYGEWFNLSGNKYI
jgi:hypothetical protein